VTGRFSSIALAGWRDRLLARHPRLFPDARLFDGPDGPTLSASGWPAVPDGWRAVVETACRRLNDAIAADPTAELVVLDIGEKWGELRIDVSSIGLNDAPREAVQLAVDLAEARSAHVCELCGGPGRLVTRNRWLATRCEADAQDHVPVRAEDRDLQIITKFVDGKPVRRARRYDVAADSFAPAALPADME
jgi:hypothetical protein